MKWTNQCGYVLTKCPGHPRAAKKDGLIFEHILVMEAMIGRYLEDDELIHHMDEDRANNSPSNLMLFTNRPAHIRFHWEMKAFQECGYRNWLMCNFCHEYDSPDNMFVSDKMHYHRECKNSWKRRDRAKKQEQQLQRLKEYVEQRSQR